MRGQVCLNENLICVGQIGAGCYRAKIFDISVLFELSVGILEGHLESKERFAIKKYLLVIGKKKNMQVLSQNFTYFST